jgi:hypothetical protein
MVAAIYSVCGSFNRLVMVPVDNGDGGEDTPITGADIGHGERG